LQNNTFLRRVSLGNFLQDRQARASSARSALSMNRKKTAAHPWLQLLRAPNLFTVPGDPLAGFLLVSGGRVEARLVCAVLASLCFYACGLLLNDLADVEEDRRERPRRPLPSGAVGLGTVRAVAGLLAVGALMLSFAAGRPAFFVGIALLVLVSLYNLWAKKIAVLGPLVMGGCRGLSVLLGACAAGAATHVPPLALLAAAGLTLYIALVTNLARTETLADPPALPRSLPFLGLLSAVAPIFFVALNRADPLGPFNLSLYALCGYTLYAGFKIHRKVTYRTAPPIPPIIGQLIRLLLPLQAIWCVASRSLAGFIAAVVLLLLWPVSRNVSRRFYAS